MPISYLSKPHITGNEKKYILDAIDSNWVAPLGPYVDKFEAELATYLDNDKHCVAVSSGTAAIHIALYSLGIKPGDIVFCSSLTFVGSSNPILYLGAIPVFIDCDIDSWCISDNALEIAFEKYKYLKKLPKALITVDLFGLTPNYKKIVQLCNKYGVPLIEDAAEALGSEYNAQKCGAFGDFGIFSFNGNKIITSSGGGALVCNSKQQAERFKFLITQSRDSCAYYQHHELGFNYRLSNICAAIGLAQLEDLQDKIRKKRENHNYYSEQLKTHPKINILTPSTNNISNYWLTCLSIKDISFKSLEALIKKLNDYEYEARHVWKPMHLQPLYRNCDFITHENDNSKKIFETSICLPSSCDIEKSTIGNISRLINKFD